MHMDVMHGTHLDQKCLNYPLYKTVFSDQWVKMSSSIWRMWISESIIIIWTRTRIPNKEFYQVTEIASSEELENSSN